MEGVLSISTGNQIRMARAALSWSVLELSKHSSVSVSTIKRIESENGLATATPANIRLIISTLEAAGIEFVGAPSEGPGVRLWQK